MYAAVVQYGNGAKHSFHFDLVKVFQHKVNKKGAGPLF